MAGITKAISESTYIKVKEALQNAMRSGDVSRKLQAIKSAKEHGISMVATIFGVSRVAIMSWIEAFDEGGVDGLKIKPGRGRKDIITEDEKAIIRKWLSDDCNLTIKEVKVKIEEAFNKKLSLSGTHNIITKLNFSYITPRAEHYKQGKNLDTEFKKNLLVKCSKNPNRLLFFF